MKHWEKSKKQEPRKLESRDFQQDNQRKKKLKPVEKSKYRLKPNQSWEMDDEA